eukprot:EC124687.1.p1 GENE.EC124687.1~~EC124687.1.p1  ORF type:complete len:158 (+),score=18.89 EC124687.1:187-660(+)
MAPHVERQPSCAGEVEKIKEDLQRCERELQRAATATSSFLVARENLFYGAKDADERQQLLTSNQLLESGTARLSNAQRMARDTEDVGVGILQDLQRQKEVIVRTGAVLRGTEDNIHMAGRTLRTMATRLVANKLILYSTIAVLVLLIAAVLFVKVFR